MTKNVYRLSAIAVITVLSSGSVFAQSTAGKKSQPLATTAKGIKPNFTVPTNLS